MTIDFVIPWVDGNDPNWIQEKNNYLGLKESVDASSNRYRDWDNLKYIFRGMERFTPWVNKVYFITWGHIPDWMNTNNEKLVIVNHRDYIPEEYLPTFSANPIELNLHRINGLSEHFVYFNDDTFITNTCSERDFFGNSGLPCDLFVEEPPTFVRKDTFNNILVNDLVMINSNFDRQKVLKANKKKVYSHKNMRCYIKNRVLSTMKRHEFFGIEFSHLPQPYRKAIFDRVWSDNQETLDSVCHNRFRSAEDVNQYVLKYYQMLTGQFEPYDWRKTGIVYQLNDSNEKNNISDAIADIKSQSYKLICLNDSSVGDFDNTKQKINEALDSILPDKCSYEL